MVSDSQLMKRSKYKKVNIQITTYKKDEEDKKKMNEDKHIQRDKTNLGNKSICSICLNSKHEEKIIEKTSKKSSCPICQKICDVCIEKTPNKIETINYEIEKPQKVNKIITTKVSTKKETESKSVQTEQTDFNKNFNLLNEVLTVFQSKKLKTVTLKDASVSTNDVRKLYSKLSVSKIFQYSIDQNKPNENGKFVVMTSNNDCRKSHIDFIHKSSSIPQMKLEELKYSLKEKTKSKDAIEEVNRMFATVRRNYKHDNEFNRPSIRSGPRLLPVVETVADHNEKVFKTGVELSQKLSCKCCQTNNCMSSGDSLNCCQVKENERSNKCYHKKDSERCEKCVYMLCCHYKNCRKTQAEVMKCERCQNVKEFACEHSERSFEDSA